MKFGDSSSNGSRGVKVPVKFCDSGSKPSSDIRMPNFVTNKDNNDNDNNDDARRRTL